MAKYNIHNPTKAARVIYDGIDDGNGRQKQYHIPAGESRGGIELADHIAEDLIKRTKGEGKQEADLRLTKLDPPASVKK